MGKFKKRTSSFIDDDDESGDARPAKVSKKVKTGASPSGGAEEDKDGNMFWDLANKRRVTISNFKGGVYVNLREFWANKDGDMLPSKKGIMLNLDNYKAFLKAIPSINNELRKAGHAIDGADDAAEDDDLGEEAAKPSKKVKQDKSKSKSKKANIEATSDEEDDNDEE